VLFADLKGSMELLADRDPEEARKILDPVLELMMEAVHRYEGTVNQVMGDGIMALFGAPVAHEDHAVRACYAALRMQDAVKRYAEGIRHSQGIEVQIRVGLNSGEVIVRVIGSDLHMDYTAVGQTTHLAARMEQLATPGSTRLTAGTLRLAEGYVEVRSLGPIPIKGLSGPVEVYELVGAGAVRSRLHASAARGLTRFVGRDSELEQLRQALESAGAGRGQAVAVVGEPGVGKSRLFWEFTHSPRTGEWLILEGRSASYGKATAYLPVIELFKGYFQIEARDDSRKIREKVTGKLFSLDRALEPSLPAVLALLDVPVEDPAWERLDPSQRRQRTLDGVKRLILRESQVQPVLVIFEDLHWIDAETQALLESIVESLPTARLLLLVNYRPEYQHGWGSKTYYRQLRIDPLLPANAEVFLQSLLGDDPTLQSLKGLLIERTEGNPLSLEESVRTLVETEVLVGDRGAYRLGRPTAAIHVPATVQAILASRIDRLASEDKQLLEAASVIGKDVPFHLLEAIAGLAGDDVRRRLARLQAAEFLYEVRLFPDLEYTFRHALTHEAVYESLLQDRRRALHARIVEVLEQVSPDRPTEQVDRLAHHAFKGELWEKAVTYFRQAGERAFSRSAPAEAVACFESALAALERAPETPGNVEHAIDIRLDLRQSLYSLGQLDKMLEHLRKAEALGRALGHPRRLGWTSIHLSTALSLAGKVTEALPFATTAQSIAEELGDVRLLRAAKVCFGTVFAQAGQYRRANDLLLEILRSLEGVALGESDPVAVSCRLWLVWALVELGEFEDGLTHGRENVRIAEILDQPFSVMYACCSLAYLHRIQGNFDEAVRLLQRARTVGHSVDLPFLSGYAVTLLSYVSALSERVEEGIGLMDEALANSQRIGIARFPWTALVRLGEACLINGRLEPASAFCDGALKLARDSGQRGGEAWALHLCGEIAAHPDSPDPEKAEGHYRQAMALADELGMRPLLAYCQLGLGKLHRRTGEQDQAREHLTTAATMFREMDMRYWLEQAEARMKELG
jgi:class 3 adenylate cyclase/tetratricopeptide (TPR) repeat protein